MPQSWKKTPDWLDWEFIRTVIDPEYYGYFWMDFWIEQKKPEPERKVIQEILTKYLQKQANTDKDELNLP